MSEKRLYWISHHPCVYAYNDKDEHLGSLIYERVGAYMHWCWYQMENIRMSPGCLQEVRDKQKELFRQKIFPVATEPAKKCDKCKSAICECDWND